MTTELHWDWEPQSKTYGNYGNANQWTVKAGIHSLVRESIQNSSDARLGDTADVVFSLISLEGEARADFEDALRWDELRPHLTEMAKGANGAVAAGQIRAGLERIESSPSLMLLRIDDYGCRGLTGPEFTEDDLAELDYGNFIKLCRLDLFSGKDQAAGGSFGLGKAVYWRFSGIQTVLFYSSLPAGDAVDGQHVGRLFGVNQGTVHRVEGARFQGRGFFGFPDNDGAISSVWGDLDLAQRLRLARSDTRPGTSALILAFADPDDPSGDGAGEIKALTRLGDQLKAQIEENFWPLMTRGRLHARVDLLKNDVLVGSTHVDPEATFAELVRALKRYDSGDFDEKLEKPLDMVVRDIPITISKRRNGHEAFVHTARLVVTLSDEVKDSLEDRVCLFRKPEMMVEFVERKFEGQKYHGFLLAGVAVNPSQPTEEQKLADDFLRFSEPPPHDQWIPSHGRNQASQVHLSANYVAPWIPNLRAIKDKITEELELLFEASAFAAGREPASVFRHLKFLKSQPGEGSGSGGSARKPHLEIVQWSVQDGAWHVEVDVTAKNRPNGWVLKPRLVLMGLDGSRVPVDWGSEPYAINGCKAKSGRVRIPPKAKGRTVTARFGGTSVSNLPIPAHLATVDIDAGEVEPYVEVEQS